MTRTHSKHVRCYVDGYDMSGYARSVGPMTIAFEAVAEAAFTDEVKNAILGHGEVSIGPINAMFDNDATTGFNAVFSGGTASPRVVSVAIGALAAPAAGNPVFSWIMNQAGYQQEQGSGFMTANLSLAPSPIDSGYFQPWGYVLHPKGAETAANTATGLDGLAATTNGGIFVFHCFSSDGTVTIKAQDASTNSNGSFSDITGATSGSIDATTTPVSGFVRIAEGSTVRRYTRPQIALGTASTVTYFSAFIRHYGLT